MLVACGPLLAFIVVVDAMSSSSSLQCLPIASCHLRAVRSLVFTVASVLIDAMVTSLIADAGVVVTPGSIHRACQSR